MTSGILPKSVSLESLIFILFLTVNIHQNTYESWKIQLDSSFKFLVWCIFIFCACECFACLYVFVPLCLMPTKARRGRQIGGIWVKGGCESSGGCWQSALSRNWMLMWIVETMKRSKVLDFISFCRGTQIVRCRNNKGLVHCHYFEF